MDKTMSIEQLKRDAKRKSKAESITHSQALEALSRLHGYSSYGALRAAVINERFPTNK